MNYLNEVSWSKFGVRHSNNFFAHFRSTRSRFPSLLVLPEDGDIGKEGRYIVHIIKAAALDKVLKKAWVEDEILYDDLNTWLSDLGNHLFKQMYLISGYYKTIKFKNIASLFTYMSTTQKMPYKTWEEYIGHVPEVDDQHFTKIDAMKVFFRAGMAKRNVTSITKMLEGAIKQLKKHNQKNVLKELPVKVVEIKTSVLGNYDYVSDVMTVSPTGKFTSQAVLTIIHELGHRLYYKNMSFAQKKEVQTKFTAAYATVNDSTDVETRFDLEILKLVKPGATIHYKGRKRNYKELSPFIVLSITGDKTELASHLRPGKVSLSGPTGFIKDQKKWEVEGVELPNIEDIRNGSHDTWFPTAYSKQDHEEWFSELYSYYVNDQLKGDAADWMAEFLKKIK